MKSSVCRADSGIEPARGVRPARQLLSDKEPDVREKRRTHRLIAASVAGSVAIVVFAVLGGVGLAQSAIALVQYQYGPSVQGQAGKVTICHKAKNTISISVNAWPAHERHGDVEGECGVVDQATAATAAATTAGAATPVETETQAPSGKVKKTKQPKVKGASASSATKPQKSKPQKSKPQKTSQSTANVTAEPVSAPAAPAPKPKKVKPVKQRKASPPSQPVLDTDPAPLARGNGNAYGHVGGNGNGNGGGNGNGNGRGNGNGKK
jgi:outer membrane biosynthesis protein TonB